MYASSPGTLNTTARVERSFATMQSCNGRVNLKLRPRDPSNKNHCCWLSATCESSQLSATCESSALQSKEAGVGSGSCPGMANGVGRGQGYTYFNYIGASFWSVEASCVKVLPGPGRDLYIRHSSNFLGRREYKIETSLRLLPSPCFTARSRAKPPASKFASTTLT